MKAHFKFNREIDGKEYRKGERDLPDSLVGHWYVKALVKSGDLVLAAPLPGPSPLLKGEEKDFEAETADENFDGEHDETLLEENIVEPPKPLSKAERKALERAQRSQ